MLYILFTIFVVATLLIKFCPIITEWDKIIISSVQEVFQSVPFMVAMLADSSVYVVMIVLPISFLYFYLYSEKLADKILAIRVLAETVSLISVPLLCYLLNLVIKNIVQRPRPPYEFQPLIHPSSYSFVSSHSLITFSLYGIVIFLLLKYCKNVALKSILIFLSVLWVVIVGWSRVYLGVHYPSDVICAYLLGVIILLLYINLFNNIEKRFKKHYAKCSCNTEL